MKKLARMICVFCAIAAPQAIQCYGYISNEHLKTILADYIDGTQEYWMAKCSDALTVYNNKLEKKLTADQQVQLLLDGLYLKRIWRIVGDDPYFANWVAKFYATLVSYDCSGYDDYSLSQLLYYDYNEDDDCKFNKCPKGCENDKKIIKYFNRNSNAKVSLYNNTYDDDFNKSIIGVKENTSEEDKAKIIAIKKEVKKCLQNIYDTLNLKKKFFSSSVDTNRLQRALLPQGLIDNIKANNRLIGYIPINAQNAQHRERVNSLIEKNGERAKLSTEQKKFKQKELNDFIKFHQMLPHS